jgi:3-oxoacyl-[acyl-carrier protein] reductase
MNVSKKIVLVTGASRGIGMAIASELAINGAIVIGTATSPKGASNISEALTSHKNEGEGMVLDVNSAESIDSLIKSVSEKYGDIQILVNNAGITKDNLLIRMKDEEWDSVLSTNLTSIFKLSKSVLRSMMKSRYGKIINISSVVGHMGNAGQTNYVASKAGITGFTKSLAQEVGNRGITVNCVAPGFIDTDMTKALSDDQKEKLLSHIPLARLGNSSDVAKAVLFLASDDADYITGETIHINGGMLMA